MQGLKRSRQLKKGEVSLRVGNGAKVAALAVGSYELTLPSRILLVLDNCYYVPTMCRNIISVSCLDNDGFLLLLRIIIAPFFIKTCSMQMPIYKMVFML